MRNVKVMQVLTVCLLSTLLLTGCQDDVSAENELAYRKIGINCMEAEDYGAAVDAFQKALDQSKGKITEEEIDICYYKAAAQYANGDLEGAEKTYNSLIEYDEKTVEGYYLRGSLYLKEGETEKALADYDTATENAGCDFEIYFELYDNLMGAEMTEEADSYLKAALSLVPQDADDYTQLGRIYLLQKDYDNALENLNKGLDDGDTEANLYLAECMEAQGDSEKSQQYYESYAKDHADDSELLNKIGTILMEKEKYAEALTYFQQGLSVEKVTNEQELRKNEILALEHSGDFTTAKEKIQSYVEEYPEDEEAAREAVFLQTR